MKNSINIRVKKILVNATAGDNIGNCIIDCIDISISEKRIVELNHNDNIYVVNFKEILDGILDQNNN